MAITIFIYYDFITKTVACVCVCVDNLKCIARYFKNIQGVVPVAKIINTIRFQINKYILL